jgi:hypothetical protein
MLPNSPKVKPEPGPPMTPGDAAACVRFIVWCRNAAIRSRPIPPRWRLDTGAETPILDWRDRLVCSKCGSREIDMLVTGAKQG